MTAIAMPFPRKRKSKPARIAKGAAKTSKGAAKTSMKAGSAAAKTARKGIEAAATWKVTKFVARRGGRLLLIPIAAGGGLAAWRKLRSNASEEGPATPYGSSVGPVATPSTVTPPKATPASTDGEGSLTDAPAGAGNPPVSPPGSSS